MKNIIETLVEAILTFEPKVLDSKLCVYNPGTRLWEKFEGIEAYRRISKKLAVDARKSIAPATYRKAIDVVKCLPTDAIDVVKLDKVDRRQDFLAFLNGVFKIDGDRLVKATENEAKNAFLTRSIEASYQEAEYDNAGLLKKPVTFNKLCVSEFTEDYVNAQQALLEIIGYIICDFTKAQKAFFLIGQPRSGKSVLLDFVSEIVGRKYTSGIELDKLGERFNVAQLYGRVVNICGEIPTKPLTDIAMFKKVVGGDVVKGEYKLNPNMFEFPLTVKLLSAGNHMPDFGISDGSEAILERLHVLHFPRMIPKEQRDTRLLEKMLDERDYIVSAAVDLAVKLRCNDYKFTVTANSQRLLDEYARESRILGEFIENMCVVEEGARVYKSDFFEAFKKYVIDNGLEFKTPRLVIYSKVLEVEGVTSGKARIDGKKPLALFNGIRLKKDGEIDE